MGIQMNPLKLSKFDYAGEWFSLTQLKEWPCTKLLSHYEKG